MSTIPVPPSLLASPVHSEQAAPSITLATVTASSKPMSPTENRASAFIASHVQPSIPKDSPPTSLGQLTYNIVEKGMGWTAQTSAFVGTEIGRRLDWLRRSASQTEVEWSELFSRRMAKEDTIPKRHSVMQLGTEHDFKGLVFGVPLVEAVQNTALMDHHGPVACVVVRCIEYLDVVGLKEVGLYRVPGRHSQVNRLRSIFDAGLDYDFHAHSTPVHDVATLLKDYLRRLPEPVLPDSFLSKFLGCLPPMAQSMTTPEASDNVPLDMRPGERPVLDQLRALLLRELPLPNRALLRILCAHLNRLARYSKENKMTLSNLGLIFCPTLGVTSAAFVWMVRGWDAIFPLDDTTEWNQRNSMHMMVPIPKLEDLQIPELLAQVSESDQLVGVNIVDQEGDVSFGVLNMVKRPSRKRIAQEQQV